jgi:hypothetical protein
MSISSLPAAAHQPRGTATPGPLPGPAGTGAAGAAVSRWPPGAVSDHLPAAPAGEVICITPLINRLPPGDYVLEAAGATRVPLRTRSGKTRGRHAASGVGQPSSPGGPVHVQSVAPWRGRPEAIGDGDPGLVAGQQSWTVRLRRGGWSRTTAPRRQRPRVTAPARRSAYVFSNRRRQRC